MGKALTRLVSASTLALVLGTVSLCTPVVAAADTAVEEGKQLAFSRTQGNCLACHAIAGGALPGNIGPPLVAMRARFPDRAALRAPIWDATDKNPNSMMPPFGRNGVLSDAEIDKVVEFIYSL